MDYGSFLGRHTANKGSERKSHNVLCVSVIDDRASSQMERKSVVTGLERNKKKNFPFLLNKRMVSQIGAKKCNQKGKHGF